jgi:haloalkane dehalogenase
MVTPGAETFLRPFRSCWLHTEGGRYHYLDEGPAGAPVLVMLHGNPTWSFYYRHLVSAFKDRYRVVVPDHMGCGLSDKPPVYAYTLERHIENLEGLIAHLDLSKVTLLMHDWGGAIGMGYATRHPGKVSRLVVFNSAAFSLPRCPLRIRVCRIPLLGALLVRGLNGFARAALRFATSRPERFSESVRAGYLAPYADWDSRVAVHAFVRDIPLEADHPTRHTLDEIDRRLSTLSDKAMLIVWGADDFCFTEKDFLPQWRRRFPGARVHVLEDAGHYVVEDAHDRIVPLLDDFLGHPEPQPA